MAPFFKKKRQSVLPSAAGQQLQLQQQQQQLLQNQINDSNKRTLSLNEPRSHPVQNFAASNNSSSNTSRMNSNSSTQSPNPAAAKASTQGVSQQQQQQQQPVHYHTANIPPQSTFADHYNNNVQQHQHNGNGYQAQNQPQQYSRSATQQPVSNFADSPFQQQQQRYPPQQQTPQLHYYQSPPQQLLPRVQYPQGHRTEPVMLKSPPQQFQRGRQLQSPPQQQMANTFGKSMQQTTIQQSTIQQSMNQQSSIQQSTIPQQDASSTSLSAWKRKLLYNSPFPRYRHSASTSTAENGCLFIMGGLRDDNVYGDIWMVAPLGHGVSLDYPYLAKPIDTTEGVPLPRVCHNSILIGNAFIVYGGDTIQLNNEGHLDNNLYFFNINSMKWTTPLPKGLKPCGRYGHTITVVTFQNHNEQEESTWSSYLYLFGGQLDDERFNDMWCFDLSNFRKPSTQWRKIYDNDTGSQFQPPLLANHTMTVYDGRIFVYGGSTYNGVLSNALYSFNPVDESWSACPYTSQFQLPAVEEHSSVLYKNFLLSYGGKNQQGATMSNFTAINLDTFQVFTIEAPTNGSPGRRSGHSLTYDMVNEKLLVMGGDQLNLESANSSRDDVVFDGLKSGDTLLDLLKYSSIDPSALEYDTTYIYEFDLTQLSKYMNKNPSLKSVRSKGVQEVLNNSIKNLSEADFLAVQQVERDTPVSESHFLLDQEKTANELSQVSTRSSKVLDEEAVISSTPLKSEAAADLTGDTTNASIQMAKKVNISRNSGSAMASSSAAVKRVDSINVHRNRRIKSGASSFNDDVSMGDRAKETRVSSNATTPHNVIASSEKDFALLQSVNTTQEEFETPASSMADVSNFQPFHRIGSKVELLMDSDEEEEVEVAKLQSPATTKAALVVESQGGKNVSSSSSSLVVPHELNQGVSLRSAASDATMDSFLDNYANEATSIEHESQGSSSSVGYHEEDETPLINPATHFDQRTVGEEEGDPREFSSPVVNDLTLTPSTNQSLGRLNDTLQDESSSITLTPIAAPAFEKRENDSVEGNAFESNSFENNSFENNGFESNGFESKAFQNSAFENKRALENGNAYENNNSYKNSNTPENGDTFDKINSYKAGQLVSRDLTTETDSKNEQMLVFYERLTEIKKSLNEKMSYANDKIVQLEKLNSDKDLEIDHLKSQLSEKSAEITTLADSHDGKLRELSSTHEKSIGDHSAMIENLKNQLSLKDSEFVQLKNSLDESHQRVTSYETILNDKLLNLEKFNRVLNRQKEQLKEQQMTSLAKEEKLMKKINELTLQNQNLQVECEKYKKLHDIHNSFSMDEDVLETNDKSRSTSIGNNVEGYSAVLDSDDLNDSSIQDLSQGIDRLLENFKSTIGSK